MVELIDNISRLPGDNLKQIIQPILNSPYGYP